MLIDKTFCVMINDVIVDSLVQKCMITRVVKDWTNLKKIKLFLAAWMSIVVKIVILHELASKFNIKINIILHYYSKSSFIDGKKKTRDESKSYIWIISFPWKCFKEVSSPIFFPFHGQTSWKTQRLWIREFRLGVLANSFDKKSR